MTTDAVPSGPATPGAKPRRVRNVVLIAATFLAVLGALTGGVLAFLAYDKATSIDRSNPEVVVIQFLDASLRLKDAARLGLFVCASWSADEAMERLDPPADAVSATWGAFATVVSSGTATVSATVTYRYPARRIEAQTVTFQLADQDGWRVCDLTKAGSLDP